MSSSPFDALRRELLDPPPRRQRRSPGPDPHTPAWHERQRRIERYRQRLEDGLGIFSDVQIPERPLDDLIAELRAVAAAALGPPVQIRDAG